MTINEQDNLISVLSTSTSITENLGKQARLESEKCFEATYAKILPKIRNHIAVASTKGLWRTRIELPLSPWTLDKENQRRLIQKLKENELSAHFKLQPNKLLLVIFWSEFDMNRTSLELVQAIEELEASPPPFKHKQFRKTQKKLGFEQHPSPNSVLSIEPPKEYQAEQNFAIVPLPTTEFVIQNDVESSSDEGDRLVVTKETKISQKAAQKEVRLAEKEQRKAARQQQIQEMKKARREEKLRQKQLMKNKERLEEREKQREEKLKRKAQKAQRQQNREKKVKNEDKKKKTKFEKKKKEKKESSSSEEDRTWSESDLSSSRSDSESD